VSVADDKTNEREALTEEWETFLTSKPPEKDFGDLDKFLRKLGCEQLPMSGGSHLSYRHSKLIKHEAHGPMGIFQVALVSGTSKRHRKVRVQNIRRFLDQVVPFIIRAITEEA
jgi:hypothetical protein